MATNVSIIAPRLVGSQFTLPDGTSVVLTAGRGLHLGFPVAPSSIITSGSQEIGQSVRDFPVITVSETSVEKLRKPLKENSNKPADGEDPGADRKTLLKLSAVVEGNPFKYSTAKGSRWTEAWQKVALFLVNCPEKILEDASSKKIHTLQVLVDRHIKAYRETFEVRMSGVEEPEVKTEHDKLCQQLYEYKQQQPLPPQSKKAQRAQAVLKRDKAVKQVVRLGMNSGITNANLRAAEEEYRGSSEEEDPEKDITRQLELSQGERLDRYDLDMDWNRDSPTETEKRRIECVAGGSIRDFPTEVDKSDVLSDRVKRIPATVAGSSQNATPKFSCPPSVKYNRPVKSSGISPSYDKHPRLARAQQRENFLESMTAAAEKLSANDAERVLIEGKWREDERKERLDDRAADAAEREKDRAFQRERHTEDIATKEKSEAAERAERKEEREHAAVQQAALFKLFFESRK